MPEEEGPGPTEGHIGPVVVEDAGPADDSDRPVPSAGFAESGGLAPEETKEMEVTHSADQHESGSGVERLTAAGWAGEDKLEGVAAAVGGADDAGKQPTSPGFAKTDTATETPASGPVAGGDFHSTMNAGGETGGETGEVDMGAGIWRKALSGENVYYFHTGTGQSTWRRPSNYDSDLDELHSAAEAVAAEEAAADAAVEEATDEGGRDMEDPETLNCQTGNQSDNPADPNRAVDLRGPGESLRLDQINSDADVVQVPLVAIPPTIPRPPSSGRPSSGRLRL
jgi:hypothetical protein